MVERAPELRIRRALTADAVAVAAILREAFEEYRPAYTEAGFNATTPNCEQVGVRLQEGPMWVAFLRGDMVGTVAALAQEDALYVRGMAVLPAARGVKLGEQLLREVESFAAVHRFKRLRLSTTPFLARAISLYEHYGFAFTKNGPADLFGTPLLSMEKLI